MTSSDSKDNVWQHTATTTNVYDWRDGAVQARMTVEKTDQPTYTSSYNYGASGALETISIADGRARTVTFTNDVSGQALKRDEADQLSGGDPHEIWYRFGGRQLGYIGNNGTLDTDYVASIANRVKRPPPTQGPFRFGDPTGTSHIDFDPALDNISSYAQGSAGGSYTVQGGETLGSIAAQLWGDASLWYKIAEANGMSTANALAEGQRLTIPIGVVKSSHNASTFKPYDPAATLGETSPTNPKPQAARGNKCGLFGALFVTAFGVALSFILPPIAPALGPVLSGALTATTANVLTQGFAVATGIQDKFNWKGVAMAGLSAGIGAAVGAAFGGGSLLGSKLLTDAARGALGSAIAQGIGVATGLQDKFDWAGVAAAGIGAEFGGSG